MDLRTVGPTICSKVGLGASRARLFDGMDIGFFMKDPCPLGLPEILTVAQALWCWATGVVV